MFHRLDGRISAATLFCLLTLAAAPRAQAQSNPVTQSASMTAGVCLVTVAKTDSVHVAASPILLHTSYTAAIGDSVSASFPQESKVSVVSVKPGAADAPNSLELTLNTAEAVPGEWPLSLKGTKGACTGKVSVTQGTKK